MRPLEISLVVLTLLAAICLLIGRWRQAGRLLSVGALAVAVAHWVLEGAHWQMIPAYAALGILCLVVWKPNLGRRLSIAVGSSVLFFAAMSILFSFLLPMFRLPKPTGPYAVGTKTLYLKDSARLEDAAGSHGEARELMVQIWYPAQPSHNSLARYREPKETNGLSAYQSLILTNSRLDAPIANGGAPFPVILFNHGWHGRRTNDTFLTEELASHGYVVASIDHTYNASIVAFPDGRVVHTTAPHDVDIPESSTQERLRAVWDKELLKQVGDQLFVLNQLEAMNRTAGTAWYGRLNTNTAGAIGHSFGGAAATEMCAKDPRIRGAVNMDGWYFGAIRARGSDQPLLSIDTATVQPDLTPYLKVSVAANLDVIDFADVQTSLHRFGGYRLSVNGAAHEDFTDQPLISPIRLLAHRGLIPAARIQSIVRTYVLAFFDRTIRGEDPAILHAKISPYAEVSLGTWPASKRQTVSQDNAEGR
jgi:predicted dienelactone hydrolase